MQLKISSGNWWPFCLCLNVLKFSPSLELTIAGECAIPIEALSLLPVFRWSRSLEQTNKDIHGVTITLRQDRLIQRHGTNQHHANRAPHIPIFLLARLPKLCKSVFSLYRIYKKTLLKSTCPPGSITCPRPSGNGICQVQSSLGKTVLFHSSFIYNFTWINF